ncbi:MAG: uroporphyrinogen-III C-methyltransferase [Thermoplasmata archaeon]
MKSLHGKVFFVGAGPGDPNLLTIMALRLIQSARIIVYDSLVSSEIMSLVPEDSEKIPVRINVHDRGMTPAEIGNVMIQKVASGNDVIRLKSGDPMIFARTGEEIEVLEENGIDYDIIPGISSSIASAAVSKTMITDRRFSSSVAIVTGHEIKDKNGKRIDWGKISGSVDTLIVMMGLSTLQSYLSEMVKSGLDSRSGITLVFDATRSTQKIIKSTVEKILSDKLVPCSDLCTVIIQKYRR